MFGFLKKRMLFEQHKVVFQNLSAVPYLEGYFENEPELLGRLENIQGRALEYSKKILLQKARYPEIIKQALIDNTELRKLYDMTAGKHVNSFDAMCAPTVSWKEHYKEYMEE